MRLKPTNLEEIKITQLSELRSEEWKKLYVVDKISILQDCEQRISEFEGRKTLPVLAVDMFKLSQVHKELRGCDAIHLRTDQGTEIILDQQFLSRASSYQAFEKYMHAAAYAYQVHAIENPECHRNETEKREWTEARKNYKTDDLAGQEYRDNALEVDARCFSESCSRALKHEHEMQRAKEQLKQELNEQRKSLASQQRPQREQEPELER